MPQEIRITDTLKVAAGETLRDAAVVWDGGETNSYAVECRGTLENVLVSCRGRCSGVWHKATYADAARRVKVWEPSGVGYNAAGCWGSKLSHITIGSGKGTAFLASQANAAQIENLVVHGHSGLCVKVDRANVLRMSGLAIEACRCEGVAVLLQDVIGCSVLGTYLEDNQGVRECFLLSSSESNRLNGSCVKIQTAAVVSRHEKHDVFVATSGRWSALTVDGLASNALSAAVCRTTGSGTPLVVSCVAGVPDWISQTA